MSGICPGSLTGAHGSVSWTDRDTMGSIAPWRSRRRPPRVRVRRISCATRVRRRWVLVDGVSPGRCVWTATSKLSGIGIDVRAPGSYSPRSYPLPTRLHHGEARRVLGAEHDRRQPSSARLLDGEVPRRAVGQCEAVLAPSAILVCLSSARALPGAVPLLGAATELLGVPSSGLARRAFLGPGHVVRNLLGWRLLGHLI